MNVSKNLYYNSRQIQNMYLMDDDDDDDDKTLTQISMTAIRSSPHPLPRESLTQLMYSAVYFVISMEI